VALAGLQLESEDIQIAVNIGRDEVNLGDLALRGITLPTVQPRPIHAVQ